MLRRSSLEAVFDLNSAIEYNKYLINSYLKEKRERKLPLYDTVLASENGEESIDAIINSISPKFFAEVNDFENQIHDQTVNVVLGQTECDSEAKFEKCIFSNLFKDFSSSQIEFGEDFLNILNREKLKLEKQVSFVSRRLSDLVMENENGFSTELKAVMLTSDKLNEAKFICKQGKLDTFEFEE